MKFPEISDNERLEKLNIPDGLLDVVIDTDTFNEIDDQFALVTALLSPERLNINAIYAAPFHNERSSGPAEGMEKSFTEIFKLLSKLNKQDDKCLVFRGATEFLSHIDIPSINNASLDLVSKAMLREDNDPLYVISIGAITNVASAILIEPLIVKKIVVIWLGGHSLDWPDTAEFNMKQDIIASKTVLDSGVPLVLIPCMGVTSHLQTTVAELTKNIKGKGPVGDYLFDTFSGYESDHFGWSKVIWDISAIAFLINQDWTPSRYIKSPVLLDSLKWQIENNRHLIRYVYYVHRDPIFKDLFIKLEKTLVVKEEGEVHKK